MLLLYCFFVSWTRRLIFRVQQQQPHGGDLYEKSLKKYCQNRFFTKNAFLNFFQKSEMLLKPKFWEKRVSATLDFFFFKQKKRKILWGAHGPHGPRGPKKSINTGPVVRRLSVPVGPNGTP